MENIFSLLLCFGFAINGLSIGIGSFDELGGEVTEDITLNDSSSAYTVSKMLTIANNTTLTIDPGCRLLFQSGTGIIVRGSLVILGTSDDRVTFEPDGGKLWGTERPIVAADIRLIGGTAPSEGRLEMYLNGQWASVCSSTWDTSETGLACRLLGYTTGAMHPVVIDDDDYWLDAENNRLADFNCHGNESSFRECNYTEEQDYGSYNMVGNNVCDDRSVVGLRCEGEGPNYGNNTWAGITWINADAHEVKQDGIKAFKSKSRLRHVDVHGAGITDDLRRRPALESYGIPPLLASVKVEYSFGDGANFKDVPSVTEITDSAFSHNNGLGLSLSSTMTGRVVILTSEISYNGLGGLKINHTSNPSDHYTIYDGLCSINNNTTESFTYPVYIHSELDSNCETVFHAIRSQRVHLQIYEKSGYLLEVRDGDNATAPVIVGRFSTKTHALSTGSSLWVRATSLGFRNKLRLLITIFEEMPNTFELGDVYVHNNRFDGITADLDTASIFIRNSFALDNELNGVQLQEGKGIQIESLVTERNSLSGMKLINSNANVSITNCSLNGNGVGLTSQRTLGKQSSHMIISVTESIIRTNQKQGILLDSSEMRIEVLDNYIAENGHGGLVVVTEDQPLSEVELFVVRNVFEDNSHVTLDPGTADTAKIHVENNFISASSSSKSLIDSNYSDCNGCYLNITNNTLYSSVTEVAIHIEESASGGKVWILNNLFQNITCIHVIKISSDTNSPHEKGRISIQENKFIDNAPLEEASGNHQTSSLVSEVAYIFLRHNFFMDLFGIKLIIDVAEPTTVIPAQLNWWGSGDEDEVQGVIIDKQDHINLAGVDYFPYLASPNKSDIISQRIEDNSTFIQDGYVIGGLMNENITLQVKNQPFVVDKNIIVCQKCVLKLEPGVKIQFRPYTGIRIHGRVDFSGDRDNPIELSLKNVSENIDQSTHRLAVGEDTSEGILLEKHEGIWQPSCVADNDEFLQQICMKLGYQDMMGFEFLEDGSDGAKDTSCTNTDSPTCKTLAAVSKPCNNGNQVYLKCVPIKWAGMRFFADARPSIMNHVIIRDAGSHFDGTFDLVPAIQVDYHRHTLNNIFISSSLAGMMVMTSEPFNIQAQPMNITISGCHDDMYAFKAIFPPFSLSNITISNCNLGVLYEGFTSTKLIEFNEQFPNGLAQRQCFGNRSLEHDDILYFSLENGMATNRQPCIDSISTDDHLVIGVFVVRARLLTREKFSVYEDVERNDALLSITEDDQGTYSVISKGPTIVLEYANGQDQLDVGELIVFVRVLPASSVLVDHELNSLFWISNMEFDLSGIASGSGIEVNYLERHHSLNVTHSTMRLNGVANGVTLQGHGSVSLNDVTISDVGTGIQMDSFAGEFIMVDSDLTSSEVGIEVAGRYTLGETVHISTHVLFSRFTNSSSSAIHVRDEPRLKKTLNIEGCNFTGNYVTVRLTGCNETVFIDDVIILQSMRGIEMNDFSGNIVVTNSFISARDRALDASSTTPFPSNVFGRIESTYFTGHTYIVMHLREFAKAQSIRRARDWSIVDCRFQENAHVIKLDAPSMTDKRQSLRVSGCTFERNEGTSINMLDGSVEAQIVGNTFYENKGSSIQTGIIQSHCVLNISKNTFDSNEAGIEDFVRLSGDVAIVHISNNQFINNVGHSLLYIFDSRQIHRSKILPDSLLIAFNNITANKPDSRHTGELSCAVKIDLPRGSVTHNIITNGDFLLEICSNAVLFDESLDFINATYNWWGTTDNDIIENRMIDISDRNDIISIEHSPYLTSNDLYGNDNTMDSSPLDVNSRFTGGKIKGELTLTSHQSPYEIKSDITVLKSSLLTIEAGVVLQFHPNIGILVLGDLVADGEENSIIQMESIRSKMKSSPTLRLTGGKIPSEGRLEMLINGKWTRICRQSWTVSEATVACGQMGYAAPVRNDWSTSAFEETVSPINNATLSCRGNELYLNDCSGNATLCRDDFDVGLMCVTSSETQMGLAWGGLRIMTTSMVQKTGSAMVSSSKDKNVTLRYVDIYDAGYLHNNDGAALSLSHVSPIIEDVRIFNSVSKGIEILTPLLPFSMERVLVNYSASHGITLTRGTDVTDVVFDSVEVLGNDIGLQIVGFTGGHYANEYVGLHDICSMDDVTVTDFLMGYFDRYSETNSECTVIIRAAVVGTSLTIAVRRIDFTPGKDTLIIFDGSDYDGKIIAQFTQSSTDDTLAVESTRDTVTLKMRYASGSIKRYYLFEITTKTESEVSHIVSTSTIGQSKRNAIWFTGLRASLEISHSHVIRNHGDVISANNDQAGAVHVVMNGGNLNISQCVFEYNKAGALSIDIGRWNEVKAKEISVAITDSEFVSNTGACTLAISSHYEAPIDTVTALLSGNIIEHNRAADKYSVILISGVQLNIEKNLIKENLGKTLYWTGIKSIDNLVMVANTFFYNKAHGSTISINGKGSNFLFTQNSFTDLENIVELTAVFDDNTNKRLHAALNWWGMTSPELIQTRVETDYGENQGNIEFTTKPALQTPLATVYDFDCPIGFMTIGTNCYQLRSSVRGYDEAVEICKKLSAIITSVVHADVNAILYLMMNRDSPDRVWIYHESDRTGSELYRDCSSYDPATNATSTEPCNQRLSFVCKTFAVGMCHEQEAHVDEDIGSGNDLFICDEVSSCSMRGRCIAPNVCHCYVGFQGKSCRANAPSNERPPRFSGVLKHISIAQSSPRGTLVTHVRALDKNYEMNEPFCYHLLPTEFSERLHLNSNSGMVHLRSDAKKIKQRFAHLLVAARDAGSPPKSSMNNISVTIVETASGCPVFSQGSSYISIAHSSKPSQNSSVRATVDNRKAVYYALYEHAAEGKFQVDESSGMITSSKDLPAGRYSFVVTAYTIGDESCVSGQTVTVEVGPSKEDPSQTVTVEVGPSKEDPSQTVTVEVRPSKEDPSQTVTVEVRSSKEDPSLFSSTTYRPNENPDRTPTQADEYNMDCDTIGCENNGTCINNKCFCPCPFSGEFCQIETHCIEVSMKIENLFGKPATYDLRLGDRSDHLFHTYAEAVQEFIEGAVYSNDILAGSYMDNTVTRFREGSLVVTYQVTFDKQSLLTDSELKRVLKTSLSDYDGADGITVDTESINISGLSTADDEPGGGVNVGGGMIAIIIILSVGIIVVMVVVIVLLIRRKRKRRSYYNNLRGHPIKMNTVKREPATQDGEEVTYQDHVEPLENNSSEEPL